jgi:DNA-binding FrmR family transcriptional regulator
MDENRKKLVRRLKIAEGQVRGLQQMVEKGEYCIDVIAQASAVRQAISGVEDALMEGHLRSCVVAQVKRGQEAKATGEIMKVYKLKGR